MSYVSCKEAVQFSCQAALQRSLHQLNLNLFCLGSLTISLFFYAILFLGKPRGLCNNSNDDNNSDKTSNKQSKTLNIV